MLLGTLDAILLGNLLTNKGVYGGDGVIQLVKEDSKEIRRTMNNQSSKKYLMPPNPLNSFEIKRY